MNSQQARTLVQETFPKGFDKGRFREFTINLLNKIDESKQGQWNSTYIKDAFKEHVEKFERLGTYTSPEDEKLDVLIVHLTKESKLERARTAIRNFVADHLKQRDGKDAALVAFLSPSEKSWRFSEIPIKRISSDEQKPFINLVDRILAAKAKAADADTSKLEREIDELVYALYGLTPEEIKIVESASVKTSADRGAAK